jgi:membrane associated rhomboid family serine protease
VNLFILMVVFLAVVFRVSKPDDRARFLAMALAQARQLRAAATAPRPDYDAFADALRARTRRLIVVPAIVALNVVVFTAMVFGPGALADPATLVGWGANLGTRTTNGEWWRLVTSTFLHAGLFTLTLDTLVLLQLGAIAERFAGRAALATVYLSAGAMAGLQHVSAHPIDVGVSAAAAIFGVYGLVAACMVWQVVPTRRHSGPWDRHQPDTSVSPAELDASAMLTIDADETRACAADDATPIASPPAPVVIPLIAAKRIAVVGIVFLFFSAVAGLVTAAALTAFGVGIAYGAVAGWRAGERTPAMRPMAIAAAAYLLFAVVYAVPLRGVADVQPALDRVRRTEARSAAAFKTGLDRLARQRITADELADVLDYAIVPELEADDAVLQALTHVPVERQHAVADGREFLRLRRASWRARADALRGTHRNVRAAADMNGDGVSRIQAEGRFRSTAAATGKAEAAERAASEAFTRLFVPADR